MKNQESHALIVIGGDRPDPRALAHFPNDVTVICADSGLDHALSLGLMPHVFLGDMDSVSQRALERSLEETWKVISYDPLKDQTDTELALHYASSQGFTDITLLWGSGDRIDHVLGVLAALSHESLSSIQNLVAWIGTDRVEVMHGPRSYHDEVIVGSTVSLMPLGRSVAGVTTHGLQWNLDREVLTSQSARGVSNIAEELKISIKIESGVLAVVYPGFLSQPHFKRKTLS
ncbi:MAG: thiamine diphosphokinase [Actinomycetes bacterium]